MIRKFKTKSNDIFELNIEADDDGVLYDYDEREKNDTGKNVLGDVLHKKEAGQVYRLCAGLLVNNSVKYTVICLFIILALAIGCVLAIKCNSATITVSMSFPEITDGLNPDGSPFDIYEVLNDDVLKETSKKLGNKISADELKEHLSVVGVTNPGTFDSIQQNVLDGNENYSYFPSRYAITYLVVSDSVKSKGVLCSIKNVFENIFYPSKTEILNALTESYKAYYNGSYVIADKILSADWYSLKEADHYNRVIRFQNLINRMSRYFEQRYNENNTYVSSDGTSFGDLNAEISVLKQVDVELYKAFIIENGISTHREKLINQLRYLSAKSSNEFVKKSAERDILRDAINMYDSRVTKIVFIPSLNEKNEFYMNRTRIGIDFLVKDAESAETAANTAINNAEYYNYLIDVFQNAPMHSGSVMVQAEKMSNDIIDKIDEFIERAKKVNNEYLQSVAYEGIDVEDISYGGGFATTAVSIVKITVIWTALLYALYCIISFLRAKHRSIVKYLRNGARKNVGR